MGYNNLSVAGFIQSCLSCTLGNVPFVLSKQKHQPSMKLESRGLLIFVTVGVNSDVMKPCRMW